MRLHNSRRSSRLRLAALALLVTACEAREPTPTPLASASSSAAAVEAREAPASACAPQEQLAKLDPRRPVPLQPMMAWHQKQNMMEHLVAIQRITHALSRDDWDGVAEAGKTSSTPGRGRRAPARHTSRR